MNKETRKMFIGLLLLLVSIPLLAIHVKKIEIEFTFTELLWILFYLYWSFKAIRLVEDSIS